MIDGLAFKLGVLAAAQWIVVARLIERTAICLVSQLLPTVVYCTRTVGREDQNGVVPEALVLELLRDVADRVVKQVHHRHVRLRVT